MICFYNNSVIDPAVIHTMGVCVKETDSPIGYFGTGLKFALATLLRNNFEVALIRDGSRSTFKTRTTEIRGQGFNVVHWGNTRLGFTTDLGRNWEPWQAFRELASNAIDEGGDFAIDGCAPAGAGTIFIVTGEGVEELQEQVAGVFLERDREPLYRTPDLEVYAGDSKCIYYRGVRAYDLKHSSAFTYNILGTCALTEDRTLKYDHQVRYAIEEMFLDCDSKEIVKAVVCPESSNAFEGTIGFTWSSKDAISDTFRDAVARYRGRDNFNQAAFSVVYQEVEAPEDHSPIKLSDNEKEKIEHAIVMVGIAGYEIDPENVVIVERVRGAYDCDFDSDQILFPRKLLSKSLFTIAGILLTAHLDEKEDITTYNGNFEETIFNILFGLAERVRVYDAKGSA